MARFLVKASEFKNVCKAVNDRKLADLKKEIIEILKKQDENEVKKAVDYFNSQELHYTHLEKSLVSGKWIEKAGYGIGTVRIWKGKKYKKIAPGKWARVFEKEGRGTNIAIGKLIAKVQKIDNVEDLMAFVMANKQRFVDENGVDLPVLDKLRAAVDARNGNVGSKEKTVEDKIKENPDYPFKPKTDKERAERAAFEKDRDDFIERMDKIRQEKKTENKVSSKITEGDYVNIKEEWRDKNEKNYTYYVKEVYEDQGKALITAVNGKTAIPVSETVGLDMIEHSPNADSFKEREKVADEEESKTYWIQDNRGNRLTNEDAKARIKANLEKIDSLAENDEARKDMKIRDLKNENEHLTERLNPEDRKEIESEAEKPSKKEEKQYKETKKMLEDKIAEFDKQLKMFDNNPNANTQRLSKDVEKQKKNYVKMLENLEGEYEKKQNRSDAMKGYKNGLDKDLIRNANGSSNMYEPGDAIEREFKGGLKAIDMWNLSEEDKEKAKQKLFELSTEELKAQSGAISVTAAGPARTVKGADKKFEKVQKIRGEKQALLNELREKSRKADNQEETKKVVSSAADAIKENKLSFISEGKLYYRGNTKSNSWTVIDKIPELKDDDSIETKKNQLKELNAKSKNLGFADPEKAKVLEDINRLKNEIAYMNTDNYKLSKEGVEKSLFDDFVIDMFIDDEIEDEEELKAGETEYNDYSAEQPEDFNSTAMKVREAMDRVRNQVL